VNWGPVKIELPFHTLFWQLDGALWFSVPDAIENFQTTFPDQLGFRVQVIDDATRYAESTGGNACRERRNH
jgi:hypothetical protein